MNQYSAQNIEKNRSQRYGKKLKNQSINILMNLKCNDQFSHVLLRFIVQTPRMHSHSIHETLDLKPRKTVFLLYMIG
jgi:hypothetical protein